MSRKHGCKAAGLDRHSAVTAVYLWRNTSKAPTRDSWRRFDALNFAAHELRRALLGIDKPTAWCGDRNARIRRGIEQIGLYHPAPLPWSHVDRFQAFTAGLMDRLQQATPGNPPPAGADGSPVAWRRRGWMSAHTAIANDAASR